MRFPDNGWPSAGLTAGPLAWAVNTQASYVLASNVCGGFDPVPLVAIGAALLALAGAWFSWQAWKRRPSAHGMEAPEAGRPHRLIAGISVLIAVLFALVILMQRAASFFLDGCVCCAPCSP